LSNSQSEFRIHGYAAPFDVCGFNPDEVPGERCGAPAKYIFKIRGITALALVCEEHAATEVRQFSDLEWIKTYEGGTWIEEAAKYFD